MTKFNVEAVLGVAGDAKAKKRLKSFGVAADKLGKKLESALDAKKMAKQAGTSIKSLRTLEGRLGKTANEMAQAKAQASKLGRELKKTKSPTAKLKREFEQAQAKARKFADAHKKLKHETSEMRTELRKAGVDTRNLGALQAKAEKQAAGFARKADLLAEKRLRGQEIRRQRDRRMTKGANLTFAGTAATGVGYGMLRGLRSPVDKMRMVQRSRGELQSLGMGDKGVDAVEKRGVAMQGKLAGVTADTFISAAYDIRSGISALTDEGVAGMTEAAALTAKATKGEMAQMTSLFSTSYGIFKKTLPSLNDSQFGEQFGAALSGSVKQFKTTGAAMQQAIESAGSGAALKGMSMFEEMAALGMMQQKMQSGVAGMAMKGYADKAERADAFFKKHKIGISVTDDKGELENISSVIRQIKQRYGDKYNTKIGDIIKKAFSSEQAIKVFEGLWDQVDDLDANIAQLKKTAKKGNDYTGKMAADMDRNADAMLTIQQQKIDAAKLKLGNALIPVFEKITPWIGKMADGFGALVDKFPGVTTGVLALGAGLAGLMVTGGPLIMAAGSLNVASAHIKASAALLSNSLGTGGANGGVYGGKGKLGKWGKRGGLLGLGVGALSVGHTLLSDDSAVDKAKGVASTGGMVAGGLAGMKLGAMAGAFLGPLGAAIVTGIGGIAGSILGEKGMSALVDKLAPKIAPRSEFIFDGLVEKGAIDHDWIGNSEINDWKAIAKLTSDKLDALIKYQDFAEADVKRMQGMLTNKLAMEGKGGIKDAAVAGVLAATVSGGAVATTSPEVVKQIEDSTRVMREIKTAVKKPAIITQNNNPVYNITVPKDITNPEDQAAWLRAELTRIERAKEARQRAVLHDDVAGGA